MEDFHYIALKNSLSSVPAKALNYSSRIILSNSLDVKQVLPSKNGHARDYRGFAELMGFQYIETKKFEQFDDPTMKILDAWETRPDAMLNKLIDYLEEMERHDIIKELIPLLEKNAETFLHSQKLQEIPIQDPEVTSCPVSMYAERDIITRQDLKSGECTMYDAYVSYTDEDCGFVSTLANYLESPQIGLKLFIRGRDMLAGNPELDTNIELIKNRCRQMLIILTQNFLHSPQCEFQLSFAASLAVEQRRRILIPVVISPCDTPSILVTVSKIDLTKPDIYEWMWDRLITSLIPEGRKLMFIPSLEKFPLQICENVNSESDSSEISSPVITFPETKKHLALPLDRPLSKVSSVVIPTQVQIQFPSIKVPSEALNRCSSSEILTEVPSVISTTNSCKDLTAIPSETKSYKKLKNRFRSYFKKERFPLNTSLSSTSSGATSGFHSESTASENFACFNEGSSNDTL